MLCAVRLVKYPKLLLNAQVIGLFIKPAKRSCFLLVDELYVTFMGSVVFSSFLVKGIILIDKLIQYVSDIASVADAICKFH